MQPGCHIRRFPERQLFLPITTAYLSHDDEAGMDPHAYRQPHPPFSTKALVQPRDGLHHPQCGAHRALTIILVRLRIAKIDQQAVAQILRDVPLKALDRLGTDPLIGIQLRGERG